MATAGRKRGQRGYCGVAVETSTHETADALEIIGRYQGSVGGIIIGGLFTIFFPLLFYFVLFKTAESGLSFDNILVVIMLTPLGLFCLVFPLLMLVAEWRALRRHGEVAFILQGTREDMAWGPHGKEHVVEFQSLQRVSLDSTSVSDMGGGSYSIVSVRLYLPDGRSVSPPGDPEVVFHFLRKCFGGPMLENGRAVAPLEAE